MNSDSQKKPQPREGLSREDRAAAALRENLRKRKAQMHAQGAIKNDHNKDTE